MGLRDDLRQRALVDPQGAALAARASGDDEEASRLFEQACDFEEAARSAGRAGQALRSLHLALLAGAAPLAREATDALIAQGGAEALAAAADQIANKGFGAAAGELWLAAGRPLEAAESYATAGDPLRASRLFEQADRPADGAKALEHALTLDPSRHDLSLELGALLARHGRDRAAARALQSIPADAAERRAVLPILRGVLDKLGLEAAVAELDLELAAIPAGPPLPQPSVADVPRGPQPARLFGQYQVVREVAVTPHARILQARDASGGDVAIKIFAAAALLEHGRDALLRFEAEARALARLRHPHIVAFRGYYPEGPAIAMEWMGGGSLADRLDGPESVAPARAAEIANAVLLALGEAHRVGILHRDVKPSNVLFDDVGTPRLGDFGAAHIGDLSATATAARIGTVAFMSPEQRMGRPATARSDVYGVGMLLVSMLWGEPLVGAARTPASAAHPDLGADHERVVAALTAERQDDRPADAFDAGRLLGSVRWPTRSIPRRPRARASSRPPALEAIGRLRILGVALRQDGRAIEVAEDAWTGRRVWLAPLGSEAELERARLFARASHPALLPVLRADLESARLWVDAPSEASEPATDAPELAQVVAALGEVGFTHEALDATHVRRRADGVLEVAFPA